MFEFLYQLISTPFGYVMRWIYQFVGSYGWSLFLFALLVKVLTMPLTLKQKRATIDMQHIQPMAQKIQKTYARDQRRMQEELQNLYDREGVSPTAGCGSMFIFLPVMMGLYGVVIRPLTYFMQLTSDQINAIAERLNYTMGTGAYDQISLAGQMFSNFDKVSDISENLMRVSFDFGFLDLTATPTLSQPSLLWVIPVVAGVSSYLMSWIQQKINPMQNANPQAAASQKSMTLMMPLMSVWFTFIMPAGLGWYWICNNILGIVQEVLLSFWVKKQTAKGNDNN